MDAFFEFSFYGIPLISSQVQSVWLVFTLAVWCFNHLFLLFPSVFLVMDIFLTIPSSFFIAKRGVKAALIVELFCVEWAPCSESSSTIPSFTASLGSM